MPYLHEDEQAFRLLAYNCAQDMGLPASFVAKDYFLTMVLKEISLENPLVVFKGGSSLSKAHHVIRRFSEDVDLGMEQARPTEGQRRGMKASVCAAAGELGLKITNLGETRSKRAFNRFLMPLPKLDPEDPDNTLIVETALQTPVQPAVRREVVSFIGEYLNRIGRGSVVAEYELAPFTMPVSSMERTFADKVFALCDYFLDGQTTERQSRHIYDLHRLLGHVALDDGFALLLETVRVQRRGQFKCLSAEDGVNLAELIERIAASEVFKEDYESVTRSLLYEDVDYGEAADCLETIALFLREHERRS